jgi:hypothetical protein
MSDNHTPKIARKLPQKSTRADRLAAVLRVNLKRRKDDLRRRRGEGDGSPPNDRDP